jgi:hypothetical protein
VQIISATHGFKQAIVKTKKLFVSMLAISSSVLAISGCSPAGGGTSVGLASDKPYVDYQDLYDPGGANGWILGGGVRAEAG